MQITVQVTQEAADVLEGKTTPSDEEHDLRQLVRTFGATLEPLHPGSSDPTLRTFFMVDIADADMAGRVLEALQRHPAVEAAYIKPMEELP
jgi:hypothetical protein